MVRRRLLASVAAGALLTGCATFNTNVANAADKIAVVAQAIGNAVQQVANLPNVGAIVPASTLAQVVAWAAQAREAAAGVKTAITLYSAITAVKQAETLINAIVTELAKFPLPAPIPEILLAATIVLPIIESTLDMVAAPTPQVPRATRALTGDQAMEVLRAAAGR